MALSTTARTALHGVQRRFALLQSQHLPNTTITKSLLSNRHFNFTTSSSSPSTTTTTTTKKKKQQIIENATVHIRGEKYKSREYILLPSNLSIDMDVWNNENANDEQQQKALVESTINQSKIASLRANRNIVFGARVYNENVVLSSNDDSKNGDGDGDGDGDDVITLEDGCNRLLDVALLDAAEYGEQPQAIAALYGLCDWVSSCLHQEHESVALAKIIEEKKNSGDDTMYEAIKAIATGVPRPGHSVVGVKTFRDGQSGWEALAKEYASLEEELAEEAKLYKQKGGEITNVEYLADTSDAYIKSAGGAMIRFYFL